LSVNVPEEIEMESVSFQDFQEAKFNYWMRLFPLNHQFLSPLQYLVHH
jgi:hypothetical protein